MPRGAKTPEPAPTPEGSGGADDAGDTVSQEDRDEFAQNWDALIRKVAAIPDDIGEKLDALLAQGGTHGHAEPARQSGGAPQTGATDGGAGQPATPASQPEKKPRSRHWYYGAFRER